MPRRNNRRSGDAEGSIMQASETNIDANLRQWREEGLALGLNGKDLLDYVKDERDRQERREKEERDRQEREKEREREERREKEERDRQKEERDRQEREREREEREKEREHQIEMERLRLANGQGQPRIELGNGEDSDFVERTRRPTVKIAMFDDKAEHLEEYLSHFESQASDQNIPRDRWVANLASGLSYKARSAYAMLSGEMARDYDAVVAALYKYFRITPEKCLAAFRNATKQGAETHEQFHHRVGVLFDKWVKMEKIEREYGALRELILREQIMGTYGAELKIYLLEKGHLELAEIANLAERYEVLHPPSHRALKPRISTHHNSSHADNVRTFTTNHPPTRNNNHHRSPHQAPTDNKPTNTHPVKQEQDRRERVKPRCYTCGAWGHMARECRRSEQANAVVGVGGRLCFVDAQINGEPVRCMLDTGLTLEALVEPGLVREEDYLGESVQLAYANGGSATVPLARIMFVSEHFQGELVAGVQANAIHRASLGCQKILQHRLMGTPMDSASAAETRAVKRAAAPGPLHAPVIPLTNTGPGKMRRLQEEDPTLRELWKKVGERKEGEEAPLFEKKNGLLTRNYRARGESIS